MAMTTMSLMLDTIRPYRRRLYLCMGLLIILSGLMLIPPLLFGMIVDRVIGQAEYSLLTLLLIGLVVVPLMGMSVRITGEYLVGMIGQRLVFDLRLRLYRKIHRLSCQYMNNTTTGKLMERLRGDVTAVQGVVTNQTLSLLSQALYGMLAVVFMFYVSWLIAIMVLLAVFLYFFNYNFFVKRIKKVQRRYRRKMDQLSSRAQERLGGQVLIKSYGNERLEATRFLRENFKTERVFHRFRMLNGSYAICSSLISTATQLLVLLVGARLVIMEQLSFGLLLALVAYTQQLLQPIVQLAELSNQIQQAKVSVIRIFEQLLAPTDSIEQPGIRLRKLEGEIAFSNLYFQYDPGKPVLQHLNLYVAPGQSVALVGETGCGKSTITNLVYRFYEAQAGHLDIDGHDISTLDTNWYRRQLAIVPQDPIVFDTTIRENIAYGKPGATDEQILEAARMAEFRQVIERQPWGLDTMVGEEGAKLSVGETQRLCIARAILADPAILILDEATSSLDPQSEAAIQLALKRVMRGRTSLIIAHRLSTIVDVDQIVVLDKGKVLEQGTHAQLMAKDNGRYRKLFKTQMGAARDLVAV